MTLTFARRRSLIIGLTAAMLALLAPGVAHADPPSNDDFDAATPVSALPFTVTADIAEATRADDEPAACELFSRNTVWFDYTAPADGIVSATLTSSTFSPMLTAFTGTRGNLTAVPGSCVSQTDRTRSFHVTAGTSYHLMVMAEFGFGGTFTMTLETVPAAANDDFAAAEPVTTLSSTVGLDLGRASSEPGEPVASCDSFATQSVWYVYRPQSTRPVTVAPQFNFHRLPTVTAYRGTSLANLTELDCVSERTAVFTATAGETYYIRIAIDTDDAADLDALFAVAPPIAPLVSVSPSPMSVFDDGFFSPFSGDSLGRPLTSGVLSFGDGTSTTISDQLPVRHRYAADGTYQVQLAGSTADGRSGTGSTSVQVVTHDVTITDFTVPARARAGVTKPISVTVANTRYDETVSVELFKQSGDSFVHIGTLTQLVPARANRTVSFPFAYTYGTGDATAGSVTFKAVATLSNFLGDANQADNEKLAVTTVR